MEENQSKQILAWLELLRPLKGFPALVATVLASIAALELAWSLLPTESQLSSFPAQQVLLVVAGILLGLIFDRAGNVWDTKFFDPRFGLNGAWLNKRAGWFPSGIDLKKARDAAILTLLGPEQTGEGIYRASKEIVKQDKDTWEYISEPIILSKFTRSFIWPALLGAVAFAIIAIIAAFRTGEYVIPLICSVGALALATLLFIPYFDLRVEYMIRLYRAATRIVDNERKRTLANFSIDSPENSEEIFLSENRSAIVEGRCPIVKGNSVSNYEIEVEVLELPARQSVTQTGRMRISTFRGEWFFESAQFSGEGDFEIVATAKQGEITDWKTVTVKCVDKALAFEESIKEERRIRGAPAVKSPAPEDVYLPDVQKEMNELHKQQKEFMTLFKTGRLEDAQEVLELIFDTLDRLDPYLPLFPNDHYFQTVRAHSFKNLAMLMKASNRHVEFNRASDEAEMMFKAIRNQYPEDPGAWHGLSNISFYRGQFRKALYYIDRALEIKPDCEATRHDREVMLSFLKLTRPDIYLQ